MLKNYFIIAWRNISRHKIYTVINVLGLALGICSCIVIFLVTSFEFSFDKFHPDRDRIYRIVGEMQNPAGEKMFLNTIIPEVAGFQNQIPGFEEKVAFHSYGGSISIPNGSKPAEKFDNHIPGSYSTTAIITWPEYFNIFKHQWLSGNSQVLSEPFKVVLTESRARKYFGNIPLIKMIGKRVIYDDSLQVSVGAIVKDWMGNTDFKYTDFISITTATHSFLKDRIPTDDWASLHLHNGMTLVKLDKGTTATEINNRFEDFIKSHVKNFDPGVKLSMRLQPLSEIHFTSEFRRGDDGDDFRKAYKPTLYALMGVALFIMIIAVANFINLSTAQSIQRAKEVGVRKVLGGNRKTIMLQFLIESFVITLFSVIVSILLVIPVLSLFKDYIPDGVIFQLFKPANILFLFCISIITSLLAGFYPAIVLASYLPVISLKGSALSKDGEKLNLRKTLIVFQFSISLVFIIAATVISKQMKYMNNADKGFNPSAIITINRWNDRQGKLKLLAENMRQVHGVDKVLWQGNAPMGFAQRSGSYTFKGKQDVILQPTMEIGDETYIPFYQMKIIAGRNMVHSDSLNELVVNETMTRAMGFQHPLDAVGKMLYGTGPVKAVPIVGVVADFHQGSFHDAIQPAVILNLSSFKQSIAIRLSGSEKNVSEVRFVLSHLESEWKKIFPDTPFEYSFLNESITWLYGQEEKTAWLINASTLITIFISCMGLFGLGMFSARRRTKEIGIRKVLGASVADITIMLSRDFVMLIILSIVIAAPVSWYFMNQWLQDYTYRTNLSWWVFFVAGISALLIGLITVSYQSIKAAVANPIKSLRTE